MLVCRSLAETASAPWVEHDGARLGLHRVDPVRNAQTKRTRLPEPPAPIIAFDPAGALVEPTGSRDSNFPGDTE